MYVFMLELFKSREDFSYGNSFEMHKIKSAAVVNNSVVLMIDLNNLLVRNKCICVFKEIDITAKWAIRLNSWLVSYNLKVLCLL